MARDDGSGRARELAGELRAEVMRTRSGLEAIDARRAGAGRGDGWSRKEILGHLVDSAANNLQRFVRARVESPYTGPGYDQTAWVRALAYQGREWTDLVALWSALNLHLAYAIETLSAGDLERPCVVGDDEPVTLEWLVTDYLRHLRHHLAQIAA